MGGWIYLNIKESPMMLERALGRYELPKHRALQIFLTKGKTFIDVGANKGDFSLVASKLVGSKGRILAFEPAPDNCKWITKSIEKNGYRNIGLYEMALSDENGTAQLHIGDKSGWHSLIPGLPHREKGKIEVKMRTLDDFLQEINYSNPVDVVKIDVEGADLHVLRGAKKTLLNNKSITLLLDVHPHFGVNPDEVCNFLRELGFKIYKEEPPFDDEIVNCDEIYSLVARRV